MKQVESNEGALFAILGRSTAYLAAKDGGHAGNCQEQFLP